MLYVLDPELSDVPVDEAREFLDAIAGELATTQPVWVRSIDNVVDAEPTGADGVVFFNPPAENGAVEIEALLQRAANAGAVILPIALDVDHRRPPGTVGDNQSFDVVDHRRRRGLQDDQRGTIARAFAREALSRLQPTYTKDRLRIFLCHRRADGEGLAARLDARLQALHEHVFRDLIDIQAGEEAQERIDDALSSADVLVFLDTALAGESWWIAHELSGALGRAIPIVWVRLGDQANRVTLPVSPGPEPSLVVDDVELSDEDVQRLADDILQRAFTMARAHVRTSQQALRALKQWAAENDATLETLDARRLIYELSHARSGRSYPTRPATDVVQVFARHPTDEDRRRLEDFLTHEGLGPHERECRSFDAALMLDPTATGERVVGDWSVIEHPERFLGSLGSSPGPADEQTPGLLLFGAFPADELSHQEVKSAVHAVTTTWLRLGGAITFGGHPTFTPLVIEAARLVVPESMRERVTIYQSEWFASPAVLADLSSQIDVRATPRAADRDASLTVMRTEMIRPGAAAAVICIGGRTREGGAHVPGIDEELRLAQLAHIPVHLLGGPGGRAAELATAARRESQPWASLANALSREANQRLLETDEYERATEEVWAATI